MVNYNSNKKKIRGYKRKCKTLVKNINDYTQSFPENWEYKYWHLHLPVAQSFIDSPKTRESVRRFCIQTLINRTNYLITIKPKFELPVRVLTVISIPNLFDSQIIVFFSSDYYDSFFDRNSEYQKWSILPPYRNIAFEMNLNIPEALGVRGYKEEINDDGFRYSGELWFIGEID